MVCFVFQLETSKFYQNSRYKWKNNDKALDLHFLFILRLYKIEKLDKIKLHKKLFGFFNKKKPTCKR